MLNDEQLEVLKDSLDYTYGKNIITIRDFEHSKIPNIVESVEKAKKENEVINQIKDILYIRRKKIRNIEKANYGATETVLITESEKGFLNDFHLHQQCEIITNQGNHVKGELSYIGDNCLKIQTADIGELSIMYSSISEMNEKQIMSMEERK